MILLFGILIGFFASLISALFGGGAGLIAIPAIYWVLYHYGSYHDHLMQITVSTSCAIAVPLGMMATLKHYKYHNVDRGALNSLLFPFLFGAAIGTILINIVDSSILKTYFGVMVLAIAVWVYRFKPDPKKVWQPNKLKLKSAAALIGIVSMSLGVSVFTVPFLMKLGTDIKKSIGTSSVIVLGFSFLGSTALILLGLPVIGINEHQFGYLYLPIFLSAIIPAVIGSMLGAKLVHIMPQHIIRYCFVAMMIIVGIIMLTG